VGNKEKGTPRKKGERQGGGGGGRRAQYISCQNGPASAEGEYVKEQLKLGNR